MAEKRTIIDFFRNCPPKRAREDESVDPPRDDGADVQSTSQVIDIDVSPGQPDDDRTRGPHAEATNEGTIKAQSTSLDIADFASLKSGPNDDIKMALVKNRAPDKNFKFPPKMYADKRRVSGMKRYCLHEWFQTYNFLAYSKSTDGLFCIACVLFPMPAHKGTRAKLLISQPYRNWKDAKADLGDHTTKHYHKDSMARLEAFVGTMQDSRSRVDQRLSTGVAAAVERNRRFLTSVLRALEYCGRQGIAIRGYRDDGPIFDETDVNKGNFKELLKLMSETDEPLQTHLTNCHRNASYISKTTQNQLLDCIRDFIQGVIVKEIKGQPDGPYFGLSADEVTDCSNWEQLGIVVRYVRNDTSIEKLLEFAKCEDVKGATIANLIISVLNSAGLDPKMCTSQTYDGAGNMSGKEKGAANQFRVKTGNEDATYFHCASHELNLCLSKASSVQDVRKMVCNMQSLGIFFKFSPKRQRMLEKSINELARDSTLKSKVKPLCETRWVERHTAFEDLDALYESILHCLDSIERNDDPDVKFDAKSINEASGLANQMRTSAFIVSFQTCYYLFGFTKGLSVQLQGSSIEIVKAYEKVGLVASQLQDIRDNANPEFNSIFNKCLDMAERAGAQLAPPRVALRQTLRSNVEFRTPEEFFRWSIFVPFLDGLIQQINDRFRGRNQKAIKAMYLLPSNLGLAPTDFEDDVLDRYKGNLPSPSSFQQELKLWTRHWASETVKPITISDTLKAIEKSRMGPMFPNISRIFRILLTIPATSATVERANSSLRFVKTDFRSVMSEDRFNALVLMFVHRDIKLNYATVIDMYANRYPRRMLFLNPLNEK